MREGVRKGILLSALVAVTAWGGHALLQSGDKKETGGMGVPEPAGTDTIDIGTEDKKNVVDSPDLPWGSDPFRPERRATGEHSRPTWLVTGIVYGRSSPLAYINGCLVRQGDIVEKAEVIRIEKKAVILEYKGDRFEIPVSRG
jgi:hypothetical protein